VEEDSLSASNKDRCVSFSNLSNADVPNKHHNDLCCCKEDNRSRKGRGRSSNDNDKKKKGWDAIIDGKGLVVDYIRVKHTMPISYLVDLTLLLHHQLLSLWIGYGRGGGGGFTKDGAIKSPSVAINCECIANLQAMYNLFGHIPSLVNHLRDTLSKRIRLDGCTLVQDQ
jgi:hypothetical protein